MSIFSHTNFQLALMSVCSLALLSGGDQACAGAFKTKIPEIASNGCVPP